MIWICVGFKSEKSNNMFKDIFSLFYDVLALNMFFKYIPLRSQAPDTALVSGGREGVNTRHVVWNLFLLLGSKHLESKDTKGIHWQASMLVALSLMLCLLQ
jgi:hypothetical protein